MLRSRTRSWALAVLLAAAWLAAPAQAQVVRWDFNADGVMPDVEVPTANHFTQSFTGTETVAGGLWSLDTSASTAMYNRYMDSLSITDYAEAVVRVKVLGPTTDNGLGSTFGFVNGSGLRSIFSVNQSGVIFNQTDAATFPTTPVANMGNFHTFRLVYDASRPSGQQLTLFDGDTLVASGNAYSKGGSNVAYFGDASNGGSTDMAVDYVEFANEPPPTSLSWDFGVNGQAPEDEVAATVRAQAGTPTADSVAGGAYTIDTGANANTLSFARRMEIDDYAEVWVQMKSDSGSYSHGNHAGFRLHVNDADRAQFAVRNGAVTLNETGATVSTPTSDTYHVYRFVYDANAPAGQRTKLYKDGVFLAQGDPQGKPGLDSFVFGDATGGGKADWAIDWIRVNTSPTNLHLYEGYWSPTALPEDWNPAWSRRGPASHRTLVPGQYLTIDTPATGGDGNDPDAYCDFEIFDQPEILDLTRPSTVDFTMRVNSQAEGSYVNGITLYEEESGGTRYYPFYLDDTQVGALGASWVNLDATQWHDYRISFDPEQNAALLFIDGATSPALTCNGSFLSGFYRNGLFWGDGANSRAGNADWAFVGWTNEANFWGGVPLMVPEPTTMVLLGTGLLALAARRRRRRDA